MTCTRCSTMNPAGSLTCVSCGAPLAGGTPYRNDWGAAVARAQALEAELRQAQAGQHQDAQRIAQLTHQLNAARAELAQLQAQMGQMAPQVAYGYQSFAYAPRGNTILVLGVLSVVLCSIMGPIAWSMGGEELRRIDSQQTSPEQRGAAQAGYICGIISTVLLLLMLLFVVFAIVAASSASR